MDHGRVDLDRTDSLRVMEIEAKDSFNDHATEQSRIKQSKSYQRFNSQPPPSLMNPDQQRHWRRSFSGVMRSDEPLSPWKRQNPEKYTMFQTRSPRLSFSSRNRNSNAVAANEGDEGASKVSAPAADPVPQLPAGRYFDALQGPELEVLKDSEDLLLPMDQQWPFLLRFPINAFGIVLGLVSQVVLWKKLALTPSMQFLRIPQSVNLLLWCLALLTYAIISFTYLLKCIFYFEAVRREYYHPVRINFFFAPWVCGIFLALGVPPAIASSVHPSAWFVFMVPLFILELKIYGQWLSGGERRLSKVANPVTHISVVGNFAGALLGATLGWKEVAIFLWSVGITHYLVIFVTLYQRLPTNEVLTKEMHPVYFLFVATPCTASVAWEKITNDFGYVSRIIFFLAMFIILSLIVRINIFRGFKFSLGWWAYTFSLTGAAITSIQYSMRVRSIPTQALATLLSFVSVSVVFVLFVFTLVHAFVWKTLFPNDIAIAITKRKRKSKAAKKNSDSGNSLYRTSSDAQELTRSSSLGVKLQQHQQQQQLQQQQNPFQYQMRSLTISVGCK